MTGRILVTHFLCCLLVGWCPGARAQVSQPLLRVTLQDALDRAKRYGGQVQSASFAARLAHEDTSQSRAGLLPTVSALNQFIYTEGNGTPSGVFVANDGVHVYNEQAVVHEDLLNVVRRAELRRAQAAEAVAAAKRDVTLRGLNATVVQAFYNVVAGARKLANAQISLENASQFLDITNKQERGGEAARADVIKARLLRQQRERDLGDAQLASEKAKVALAVLIFPDVTTDFAAVDDLDNLPPLDQLTSVTSEATATSPDVRAARAGLTEASRESDVARYAYLPSLALDFYYGIDANQFAATTDSPTPESGRSTLPDYLVSNRHNLGYSGQITLNIPIWNWGATRSKVRQTEIREEQAKLDLSVAQRQLRANIASDYMEAKAAGEQIESLRSGVDLSVESLRLTLLRYQAGESTVLEVVDAQSTLTNARNAYADGLVRYRVALANVQSLTGHL